MGLEELIVKYRNRANKLLMRGDNKSLAGSAYYSAAREAVQNLVSQGPLPTGQIWRLNDMLSFSTSWTSTKA